MFTPFTTLLHVSRQIRNIHVFLRIFLIRETPFIQFLFPFRLITHRLREKDL